MAVKGMISVPLVSSKKLRVLDTVDIRICISGKDTENKFAIFEETVPPHYGVPFHIHKNEDEMFHILEGQYQIWCGSETYVANPGDTVILPRNTPHTFYNLSSSRGRTLNTYLPGGFDEFVEVLSSYPKGTDLTDLDELSKKYGIYYSHFLPWKAEGPLHKMPDRFYATSDLVKDIRFTDSEALKIYDLIDKKIETELQIIKY